MDKVRVGEVVISFLLPIIGIIFYMVHIDNKPKKANDLLLSAVIGIFIGLIIFIYPTITEPWL